MNKYPEAISYFKKALVLDPENDTYKSNLKIAEQKQKEASSPVSKQTGLYIIYCIIFWCCICVHTDSCWIGIWHG